MSPIRALALALKPACGIVLLLTLGLAPGMSAAAESPAVIRLALVSDTHTTRGTKDDQPLYRGRLDRVIADINAAKVDVVLIAGDLTQNGKPEEFDDFTAQIRALQAPVCCAPGNHDVGNKRIPDKQPGSTAARLAHYEQKLGPSFYARQVGGVRVLAVNSQLMGSGLPQEEKQWAWLGQELAAPATSPVVVFLHMPPFVKAPDEPGGDYWNLEPEPRKRFLALLKRGGVRTVLTGHLHYSLTNHYEGMLVVTTLPVSFGLPAGVAPQGWTLVTLPREGDAKVEFRTVRD